MRRSLVTTCTAVTGLVLVVSWSTSLARGSAATSLSAPAIDPSTHPSRPVLAPTPVVTAPPTAPAPVASAPPSTSVEPEDPAPAPPAAPAPAPAPEPAVVTYDGATAGTPYGPVQVRITVTAGVLTSAEAIQLPSGNRYDEQVKASAVPVLNHEAVAAQSAHLSMVSGATYTSGAYAQSLQSALDQAGR